MTEATVDRLDRTDELESKQDRSEAPPELFSDEEVSQIALEVRQFHQLPMQVIEKYAEIAAQRHGVPKRLPDGTWFATVPSFAGVWANESSQEETLEALEEVVLDWTLLKIEHGDRDLPVLEEIDLNVL